ncbi:Ubiquinol-cytochrome C reductase complex 14kD subunit [Popillia japonica]|uniref:Cytochrome b-c1 complex subunit 7 n=1 Tax=Popillia japonica TaxID=7064 RepID=A0AAW1MIM8_POPJA
MALFFVQKRAMSSALQKFCYNLSGFNKYGLMRDDVLYEDEDVKEALKRLPTKVLDERNYRILRAVQLDIQKSILPKEQWTKLEEDVLYLQPILQQVVKERQEREEWNKNY